MYVAMSCNIKIQDRTFASVVGCNIKRSVHFLGAAARVRVPKTAVLHQKDEKTYVETASQFRRGDFVNIKLGYNNQLEEEFIGTVASVNQASPVEIVCEDFYLFKLKEKNLKRAFKNAKLKEIIEYCIEGVGLTMVGDLPDMIISQFVINNVSAAAVLQEIKDEYWNTINIDHQGNLYVGLEYLQNYGEVKYKLGWNTKSEDRMEYKDAANKKLRIKVVNFKPDGSKVEKEVGEKGGELRTVFLYDVKVDSSAELEAKAKQELEKYNYTGYDGSFTAFLQPFCTAGMTAVIEDPVYTERSGSYFIESVETNFESGAERIIEIGRKL